MSQQKDNTSLTNGDSSRNYSAYKRALSFAGVLQTRYMASLNNNVDITGIRTDHKERPA